MAVHVLLYVYLCYHSEKVYWETYLANGIVPAKCTHRVGKLRLEMKMKKADPVQWSEYEVIQLCVDRMT